MIKDYSLLLNVCSISEDYKKFNLKDRQIDALLTMKNEEAKFTYNSYMEQYNISKSTAKRGFKIFGRAKIN